MDGLVRYAEKRSHTRRAVDKRGTVNDQAGAVMAVKIRDLSASGAGLELADAAELPDEFDLLIVDDCLLYRVQVRWRHRDRLGVEFVSVPRKVLSAL